MKAILLLAVLVTFTGLAKADNNEQPFQQAWLTTLVGDWQNAVEYDVMSPGQTVDSIYEALVKEISTSKDEEVLKMAAEDLNKTATRLGQRERSASKGQWNMVTLINPKARFGDGVKSALLKTAMTLDCENNPADNPKICKDESLKCSYATLKERAYIEFVMRAYKERTKKLINRVEEKI